MRLVSSDFLPPTIRHKNINNVYPSSVIPKSRKKKANKDSYSYLSEGDIQQLLQQTTMSAVTCTVLRLASRQRAPASTIISSLQRQQQKAPHNEFRRVRLWRPRTRNLRSASAATAALASNHGGVSPTTTRITTTTRQQQQQGVEAGAAAMLLLAALGAASYNSNTNNNTTRSSSAAAASLLPTPSTTTTAVQLEPRRTTAAAASATTTTKATNLGRFPSLRGHGMNEKYAVDWNMVLGEGAYGSVHPARLAATGEKVRVFRCCCCGCCCMPT